MKKVLQLVLALLLVLVGQLKAATPAFVQSNSSSGGVAGSTGLAFSSTVTKTDAVYAFMFDGSSSGDTITFSDSMSNSWSTIASNNLSTDGDTIALGCAVVTASSGSDTVYFKINGSSSATGSFVIYEVQNATCTTDATTLTPSHSTGGPGTTVTCSVGPITTNTANDLLLFGCGSSHNGSWSLGSGWSHLVVDNGSSSASALEMEVATSTGGYTGTDTETISSGTWEYAGILAAFKATGNSYTATPSETNTASDSLSRTANFARADSETNTASDTLARVVHFGRGPAETNTTTDSVARVGGFGRGDTETNTASDSLSAAKEGQFSASISETLTFSDSVNRLATLARGASETNTASDSVARVGGFSRGDSETNTASDALARLATYQRGNTEANTASDLLAASRTHTAAISETLTASDSIARGAQYWRGNVIAVYWLPPAGASGNSSYAYNIYRGLSSGTETGPINASPIDAGCTGYSNCLYLDNNITAGVEYYYEITVVFGGNESLVSSESATLALANAVTETDVAADSLGRQAGFPRTASETNTASDALSRLAGFGRGDSETNTASDLLARLGTFKRAGSETNTANDLVSASHSGGGVFSAVISETLVFADSLARLGTFGRSGSESNTATDALARAAGFSRGDSETNTAGDALSRRGAFLRSGAETNATGDALGRLAAFYRQAAEAESFSDVVASFWTRYLGIPVQPRHAGTVPGRSKTGEASGSTKSGTAPVH